MESDMCKKQMTQIVIAIASKIGLFLLTSN